MLEPGELSKVFLIVLLTFLAALFLITKVFEWVGVG